MMKWGILGTATIAETAIAPAITSQEDNILLAVASRTITKAKSFAKKFNCFAIEGYENLLNNSNIDAVYIPLPTGMHYEWVKKALIRNKHVLVEKSVVCSYEEAEEICNLAESKNLAVVENFQFQFHSQHKFVRDFIQNQKLGDIRCFRSNFGFPPFDMANNIRYKKELGGGALLDAGAYTLKAVSFILGDGYTVSSAFLANHSSLGVDWYGGGQLHNNEKDIFAQVAFGFDNFYQCNYEIWGSKAKLSCSRAYTAKPGYNPIIIVETPDGREEVSLDSDNHFENMIRHFNTIVKTGKLETERQKILTQMKLIKDFRSFAELNNKTKS